MEVERVIIRLEEAWPYWYIKIFKNGRWSTTPFRFVSREEAIRNIDIVTKALRKHGFTTVTEPEVNTVA